MEVKLVVGKGKTTVREIPIVGVSTTFGRRTDCTVRIPSPLVSRLHCELILEEARVLVKDLGSANGTFVNGAKVKEKELHSGDTLGVGPLTFIVQVAGAPAGPSDAARPGTGEEAAEAVAVAEAVPDEAADFVVNEAAPADDAADFVVPSEEPATQAGGEFVVADDSTTAEADFVVAEEVGSEGDTVHDLTLDQVVAADKAASAANDDATFVMAEAEADESAPPPESKPNKKGGLFGRLFGKKEKKPAAELPPTAKPTKVAEPAAAPPAKPSADTKPHAPAAPHFATQDAEQPNQPAPKVADEDLADFLMGLNEKDQ